MTAEFMGEGECKCVWARLHSGLRWPSSALRPQAPALAPCGEGRGQARPGRKGTERWVSALPGDVNLDSK